MSKVTYVGTEDDPHTQVITEGGIRFIKGEPETVPDDHRWMEQFKGNPTFAVDNEPAHVADNEEEANALRAELDARGIKYGKTASVQTLRDKLAAGEDTGV